MAEFCVCGSLLLDGSCTNKNCTNKSAVKQKTTAAKKTGAKNDTLESKPKTTRTRRASKCITYNLNDLKEENSV